MFFIDIVYPIKKSHPTIQIFSKKMENMRAKMVAMLLMMVFVSAHGDCYDDCMRSCVGFFETCSPSCTDKCYPVHPPRKIKATAPASHAFQRGGPDLKEGEQRGL